MLTWRHPFHRLKLKVYMSSAGVADEEKADPQAVARLTRLVAGIKDHGKHRLLAFDKHYRRDGSVNLEKTEFYVPNEYVFELAERHPSCLCRIFRQSLPAGCDCRAREMGATGARIVKWLPNAMGIDPSDPQCDSFYEKDEGA